MDSFFNQMRSAKAASYGSPSMIKIENGAAVDITVDGASKTVYIASNDGISGGSGLGIPHNTRGYFSESPGAGPENYFTPNLLGGSVEFDVDLSSMECGCIAAFYTVSMPAKDGSGNYTPGEDGFYYCDANQVGGTYCPEFDIMEANKYAMQTTPHSCDSPTDKGHYNNCNRSGSCWQNTKDKLSWAYGPGSQIDTTRDFHYKIDFNESGGTFTNFVVTLSQGGNTVSMDGNCGDNSYMSYDIANGMAFAFSNWETTDNWLWGNTCYGSCSGNPYLNISNINIVTGSGTPVPPVDDYTYGDSCATKWDDYCDGSCDCRWSWPSSDPAQWASDDAACRCAQ